MRQVWNKLRSRSNLSVFEVWVSTSVSLKLLYYLIIRVNNVTAWVIKWISLCLALVPLRSSVMSLNCRCSDSPRRPLTLLNVGTVHVHGALLQLHSFWRVEDKIQPLTFTVHGLEKERIYFEGASWPRRRFGRNSNCWKWGGDCGGCPLHPPPAPPRPSARKGLSDSHLPPRCHTKSEAGT